MIKSGVSNTRKKSIVCGSSGCLYGEYGSSGCRTSKKSGIIELDINGNTVLNSPYITEKSNINIIVQSGVPDNTIYIKNIKVGSCEIASISGNSNLKISYTIT